MIILDEKIEKAQAAVVAAKEKYDAVLDEPEKLVAKKRKCTSHTLVPVTVKIK